MILIAQYRDQGARIDFRNLHPGSASAETRLHWKTDLRLQSIDPDKGYMNSFRLPLALAVDEALLDHRRLQNMEILQAMHRLLVGYPTTPFNRHGMTDDHCFGSLYWQNRPVAPDFIQLAMKPGRKEIKLRMLEGKTGTPLGYATLAQDHALLSLSQGIADQGPFFEGNCHAFQLTGSFRVKK